MKVRPGNQGGQTRPRSPREMATAYRDWSQNARQPAPYGRYEDKSPLPAPKPKARGTKRPAGPSSRGTTVPQRSMKGTTVPRKRGK